MSDERSIEKRGMYLDDWIRLVEDEHKNTLL